jgi:hypothetical protein
MVTGIVNTGLHVPVPPKYAVDRVKSRNCVWVESLGSSLTELVMIVRRILQHIDGRTVSFQIFTRFYIPLAPVESKNKRPFSENDPFYASRHIFFSIPRARGKLQKLPRQPRHVPSLIQGY